jgi:predicted RNA-binding Zn-ribbon protein involved in translation (DUF1610 family)
MSEIHWNSIQSIRDKETNTPIPLPSCSIQKIAAKFSNTKIPIYKLTINNKAISRNNSLLVTFSCPTCGVVREITLNLFMRRIQKNTQCCYVCINKDETKRNNHIAFFHNLANGETHTKEMKVSSLSLEQHIQYSISQWKEEDPRFIEAYEQRHLSVDEFERIRSRIRSIGNGKITDLSTWKYIFNYRVFNQSKYTPMLIQGDLVEKPLYITFDCENCGNIYVHRDIEVVKNKLKMLCQSCSLTNRTFRLRNMILKNGSSILWQSQQEKRFIDWCEENMIEIKNGPSISYIWNGNQHTYRVDFELPTLKYLVEIKDNHCWHIEQVKSGKFGEKESAAKQWCAEHGYIFEVVYPKTLQEFKNSLEKKVKCL